MTESKSPNILYHYTQQTGFLEIIRTQKIWATDVFYLNDSAEMRYAWTIAEELLKTPGIAKCRAEELLIEGFSTVEDLPLGAKVFVTSFSGARNQLSQWRAYGSEGGGFSIGFDFNELQVSGEPEVELRHCIYQREQQKSMMHETIERALEIYRTDPSSAAETSGENSNDPVKEAMLTFAIDYLQLAPTFKDPSFSDEDEFRLIGWYGKLKHGRKMLFRKGRSTIIPYGELDLPKNNGILSVKEVLVGPNPNPDLAVLSAKHFIKDEGIDPEMVKYCDIPYRSLGM